MKLRIVAFIAAATSVVAFLLIILGPWMFRILIRVNALDDNYFAGAFVWLFCWGIPLHIFILGVIVDCCSGSIRASESFIGLGMTSLDVQVKKLARRVVPLFIALIVISEWLCRAMQTMMQAETFGGLLALLFPALFYCLAGAGFAVVKFYLLAPLQDEAKVPPREKPSVREVKFIKSADRP